MRCRRARRSLLAALDGELAPVEREALDAHLRACEACRAVGDETAHLHRALAAMPRVAGLPPGLAEATMRRVRADAADDSPRWRALGSRGAWWWMAAPVAATIAGVAVWRSLPTSLAPPEPAAPPQVVASRPVERAPKPRPAPGAPERIADGAPVRSTDRATPPPQVAEALELFLDMPILENMEKLQNYEAIRTVDVGDDGQADRRG